MCTVSASCAGACTTITCFMLYDLLKQTFFFQRLFLLSNIHTDMSGWTFPLEKATMVFGVFHLKLCVLCFSGSILTD